MKLFRREMDPRCAYCQFASTLNDRECMCVKRGVVPMEHHWQVRDLPVDYHGTIKVS